MPNETMENSTTTEFSETTELQSDSNDIFSRWLGISSEDSSINATAEQKKMMFEDWAKYTTEVQNPAQTKLNPFTKANYAPLDEVLNTVKPVLGKYGFGIMQIPTYTNSAVGVQTIITHSSGGCFVFEKLSIPSKGDAQSIVAASTYARRAALNAICGVYGENDDDGNTTSGKNTKAPPKPPQIELDKTIQAIIKECTDKKNSGANSDTLYKIIETHNNSKDPRAIKDLATAKKILEEIKKA